MRSAGHAILDNQRPHPVAVTPHDSVRRAVRLCLIRKECGVNAAKHDPRAPFASQTADLVSPPRVAGVNTDPDYVACVNGFESDRIQGLVDEVWIAPPLSSCCRQHIEPPWRDDRDAKGEVAGIDQMDLRNSVHVKARHAALKRSTSPW